MLYTSTRYRNAIFNERQMAAKVSITLADGTKLEYGPERLWSGGLSIEDAVSGTDFGPGGVVIGQCTVKLGNMDEALSGYDFIGAQVIPYVGMVFEDSTEWLKKGVFTVETPTFKAGLVTLTCLDKLYKLDRSYDTSLHFPVALANIVLDVCECCGVELVSSQFPNAGFTVQNKPDSATTYREVLSYAAQIAGCFARCNVGGELELRWFDVTALESNDLDGGRLDDTTQAAYPSGDTADGGQFDAGYPYYTTGHTVDGGGFDSPAYHSLYMLTSLDVAIDDVVITGVRVDATLEEGEESYLSGTEGYVLTVTDNPFIGSGQARAVADYLANHLVGLRFRPLTLETVSDPSIEAGDVAYAVDLKGNQYPTLITSLSYTYGSAERIDCEAESPAANSSTRYSAVTKAQIAARKQVEREAAERAQALAAEQHAREQGLSAEEQARQQAIAEEKRVREQAIASLNTRLDNSSGTYTTVTTAPDGSKIYYLHDKARLQDSRIVWKMTAEAWAVSSDGGQSYSYGMMVNGDVVTRILSAVGINAEWIKVFTSFTVGQNFSVDYRGVIKALAGRIGNFEIVDGALRAGLGPDGLEYDAYITYDYHGLAAKGNTIDIGGTQYTESARLDLSTDGGGGRASLNLTDSEVTITLNYENAPMPDDYDNYGTFRINGAKRILMNAKGGGIDLMEESSSISTKNTFMITVVDTPDNWLDGPEIHLNVGDSGKIYLNAGTVDIAGKLCRNGVQLPI